MSVDTASGGSGTGQLREMRALGRLMQRSVETSTVYDGTDGTGLVTVLVNGRGVVQDVAIDPAWVNTIGPSGLGAALLQAFQAANITALSASLQNLRTAVDRDEVAAGVAELTTEESASRPEKTYEELVAELEEANRELERTLARVAEFERLTGVSGRANLLRMDLDRGRMTGITVVDPRRATQVSSYQLATEAVSMFQAAAPPSV